ncbi:hypothetical protein ABW19_dt0206180 [Dactylella cylindrospora]|nr:hypothetical protein ABW19_dt0206180 [Dactylella cylindrospora]
MPRLPYTTLDVFTTEPLKAGNPLAIVTIPADVTLTKSQEHLIAREFNYSETVFIYPSTSPLTSPDGTTRIAIWTTDQELPFAGHPTVGTGWYLASSGEERFTENFDVDILAGRLKVERSEAGKVRIDAPHKVTKWENKVPLKRLSEVIALPSSLPIESIFADSCKAGIPALSIVDGLSFALVQISNLEALAGLKPGSKGASLDLVKDVGGDLPSVGTPFMGVYCYVILEESDGKLVIRSRMFYDGDQEDPATGSAACALGSYLALVKGGREWEFEITQGVEMGRKSDIGVKVVLDGEGGVEKVWLEGGAVKVMEGVLTI